MTERMSDPTWMYRSGQFGRLESRLFDHPDDIPDGQRWVDSPDKVTPASDGEAKPKKPRKPRKKKASDAS